MIFFYWTSIKFYTIIREDTFLRKYNGDIDKVVLKNTPKNHRMTAHTFKNKKQMLR
jgi:hypothetical protein